MKIREAILVLIALPCFAQQQPTQAKPQCYKNGHLFGPADDSGKCPAGMQAIGSAMPPPTGTSAPPPANQPPMGPAPQFTQLEQVIAKDISQKQSDLQQEINDFLREIRTSHPGYEFMNGNLVPIQQPPAPPKPEEKK